MNRNHRYSVLGLAACAALLVFSLTACSSTQRASTQVDDAAITAEVKTKLTADPEINPFNIDVDTDEGMVRLSGTVEKQVAKDEAERLARNTRGVRSVENDIKVGKTTIANRVEKSALATKVKTKITADPDLNPFNIDVDADEDGTITLTGRVASQSAKDEAGRLAKNTEGVAHVHNELRVGDMNPEG